MSVRERVLFMLLKNIKDIKIFNKIDKIKHNNDTIFSKRYPLIDKYINDEDVKNYLINDEDFKNKYDINSTLIEAFLYELSKHFDDEQIVKIVYTSIISYDNDSLEELIMRYLNSSDITKKCFAFFEKYDKKFNMKEKRTKDLERERKIDDLYNTNKTGSETFGSASLDSLYKNLDLNGKEYIANLIAHEEIDKSYSIFKDMFEYSYQDNIDVLIKILIKKGITYKIINNNVLSELQEKCFCQLIDNLIREKSIKSCNTIVKLIDERKYNLVLRLVTNNIVSNAYMIDTDEVKKEDSDDEIVRKLYKKSSSKSAA